jgi:succinate dehydrogenase / fumarate reductase flavoprotein subunit
MWDHCGMARNAEGLEKAKALVRQLREEFYQHVFVPGNSDDFNPELEKAYRVADFLEMGELMIHDALSRHESCGGHFREEYQSADGEALRNDEDFTYVASWEWTDTNQAPVMHKEELRFENVELKTRSYK